MKGGTHACPINDIAEHCVLAHCTNPLLFVFLQAVVHRSNKAEGDDKRLQALGYQPLLKRRLTSFSNFATSFSVVSILVGLLLHAWDVQQEQLIGGVIYTSGFQSCEYSEQA